MTLEALYYISQILAALGIICSLIFVGIQVRQSTEQAKRNEAATKAAAAEATHRSFLDWYYAQTLETAEISVKANQDFESLTAAERVLLFMEVMPFLMNLQEAHTKWFEGSLTEDRWRFWDEIAATVATTPTVLKVWDSRRFMFSDAFQSYLDGKFAQMGSIPTSAKSWIVPDVRPEDTPENGEPRT